MVGLARAGLLCNTSMLRSPLSPLPPRAPTPTTNPALVHPGVLDQWEVADVSQPRGGAQR